MVSLFERLVQGRPPEETAPRPTPKPDSWGVNQVLHWLQYGWDKPTISSSELYRQGPLPVRGDRARALEIADQLERRGYLIPIRAKQYRTKRWQIALQPDLKEGRARYRVVESSSCELIRTFCK